MANEKVNLVLRLDPVTHKAIKRKAEQNYQSLNGMINSILAKEVRGEKNSKKDLVVSK